jgi:hypothetical protein
MFDRAGMPWKLNTVRRVLMAWGEGNPENS